MSKTLTVEKMRPMVEEMVEQKLIELLGDPDTGLELRDEIKTHLKKTLASKVCGVSLEKVAQRLKLKW
jgi:cytochrome P450